MALLGGRYELAEPRGSGGMARVVAAYDRVLDRRVAIKLINDAQLGDPAGPERFAREARAAAALQHPNTVGVFDVGDDDGRPFIVMELVDGRSLADQLATDGRLSPAETVRVGDAVLAGLAAAHERGLVHRDIKPSNILLAGDGAVKLADFGIATALAGSTEPLTGTGLIIGTTRYLAPECAAGQRATAASDLYSLGAVLYECLAGRAPFDAETPVGLAVAHQCAPVPRVADAAPDAPATVAGAIERALAKDPAARFVDAEAMRRALLGADDTAAPGHASGPADTVRLLVGSGTAGHTAAASPMATSLLETREKSPERSPWRTYWAVAAAAVVAALLVAFVAGYLLTRDDDPDGTAPPAGLDGEPGADEEANGDDLADGEADQPATLSDLIGDLTSDATVLGERADDLLAKLVELPSGSSAGDARELIKDIATWLADGELDPDAGAAAINLLEGENRPAGEELADVSQLFAEVATTLPQWDDKGKSLLSKLDDLLGTGSPGQQAQKARDLTEELEKWMAKDEIDAQRARDAVAVLESIR